MKKTYYSWLFYIEWTTDVKAKALEGRDIYLSKVQPASYTKITVALYPSQPSKRKHLILILEPFRMVAQYASIWYLYLFMLLIVSILIQSWLYMRPPALWKALAQLHHRFGPDFRGQQSSVSLAVDPWIFWTSYGSLWSVVNKRDTNTHLNTTPPAYSKSCCCMASFRVHSADLRPQCTKAGKEHWKSCEVRRFGNFGHVRVAA